MPRGSSAGWATKVAKKHGAHARLSLKPTDRGEKFGIVHYAGRVEYTVEAFYDKNLDTLSEARRSWFISFRFVSFRLVSFRLVSSRLVSFRFVSFRFVSFRFVSFLPWRLAFDVAVPHRWAVLFSFFRHFCPSPSGAWLFAFDLAVRRRRAV